MIGVALAVTALDVAGAKSARPYPVGSAPSILSNLVPVWIAAYARQGGLARVEEPFGPPQGALDPKLGAFLDGRLDFAFLTREIAERDLAHFRLRHRGRDPVILPVAGGNWRRFGYVDAVVFVVHPENPVRSLSYRQIDAIFSASRWRGGPEAKVWGDLGLTGAWRTKAIRPMGGGAWFAEESARALTVRRHILSCGGHVGRWRSAPGTGNDQDVVERVSAERGAIGFTGMGHVSPAVRVIAIAAPDRSAVLPDRRNAQTGRYPLLRTVDLLIDREASAATLSFARFLLTRSGQSAVARQEDFMPLPNASRRAAAKLLSDLVRNRGSAGSPSIDSAVGSCWTGEPRQAQRSPWPAFY